MDDNLDLRLKRRLRDFLASKRANDPTTAVRASIREVLDRIIERRWRSYIVGGTLRDVMLAPPSTFPRDRPRSRWLVASESRRRLRRLSNPQDAVRGAPLGEAL
jgi:hypothetical protein